MIVSNQERVVATGYNGPPSDFLPLYRDGELVEEWWLDDCRNWCDRGRKGPESLPPELLYDDCPSNHAEINALMHSSRLDREGGAIYVTGSACMTCAKAIANSGIQYVYIVNVDEEADAHRNPSKVNEFLRACGLSVLRITVSS